MQRQKCVQPETLQLERLPLLDLNEEFHEPDAKTSIAPVIKTQERRIQGIGYDFENIVRTICGLEHGSHVSKEFRLNFLTWFSL